MKTFPMAITDSEPQTPLCKLFYKYYSDKCPQIHHSYSPAYFKLLSPYKNKLRYMLEIGIGSHAYMDNISSEDYVQGASLLAFADFFESGMIIGVDIDPSVLFESQSIKTFLMDQSSEESILRLMSQLEKEAICELDIILDDGSHVVEHMVLSLRTLFPYLQKEGLYIIEDIKRQDLAFFMKQVPEDGYIAYIHEGVRDWDSFIVYKKL